MRRTRKTKTKTRKPETRRERRKNQRENLREIRVVRRGWLYRAYEGLAVLLSAPHNPLISSDLSSGFSSVPSVFQVFWFCFYYFFSPRISSSSLPCALKARMTL